MNLMYILFVICLLGKYTFAFDLKAYKKIIDEDWDKFIKNIQNMSNDTDLRIFYELKMVDNQTIIVKVIYCFLIYFLIKFD